MQVRIKFYMMVKKKGIQNGDKLQYTNRED